MMRYSVILFDLDGTILNTLNDLAASTNRALAKNGLPTRSTEEVRRFVGNGIRLLIDRPLMHLIMDTGMSGNVCHSLAIRTIRKDQKMIVLPGQRRYGSLNTKGSASLHQYRRIFLRRYACKL